MDFEHFRQTGVSVSGLQYQGWKFGPVLIDVMEEWEDFELDSLRLKSDAGVLTKDDIRTVAGYFVVVTPNSTKAIAP